MTRRKVPSPQLPLLLGSGWLFNILSVDFVSVWFSLERSSVASRAFFSILTDFLFAPPHSAKVALLNQNS